MVARRADDDSVGVAQRPAGAAIVTGRSAGVLVERCVLLGAPAVSLAGTLARVERSLLRGGVTHLACADEVGRGALSGPATIGMVVITVQTRTAPQGVRDSKLLTPEARTALTDLVTQAHDTPEWRDVLAKNGFDDVFLPGEEFAGFLTEEEKRVQAILSDIGLT